MIENILSKQTLVIQKYLMKMGATAEDAEDIVQEAICKAIEYVDAFESDTIIPWLFKVSINKYYNLYNRRKRIEIELNQKALLKLCSEDGIEKQFLFQELKSNVRTVLDSMKESYRNLIIMKYFMDLSYKEMALILGFEESKVKTYLYRARVKFSKLWEEAGYEQ